MKIYTKTGDQGETMLFGGTRVSKHDLRIEAYGTVDELNAHLGLLRDVAEEPADRELLLWLQDRLFTLGSILATAPGNTKVKLPPLLPDDVERLEKAIDVMDEQLPEMKSFILPGGHVHVSYTHIARCVCRRAERATIALSHNESVDFIVIQFLNRLSDYLFMLSRKWAQLLDVQEVPWKPKMG